MDSSHLQKARKKTADAFHSFLGYSLSPERLRQLDLLIEKAAPYQIPCLEGFSELLGDLEKGCDREGRDKIGTDLLNLSFSQGQETHNALLGLQIAIHTLHQKPDALAKIWPELITKAEANELTSANLPPLCQNLALIIAAAGNHTLHTYYILNKVIPLVEKLGDPGLIDRWAEGLRQPEASLWAAFIAAAEEPFFAFSQLLDETLEENDHLANWLTGQEKAFQEVVRATQWKDEAREEELKTWRQIITTVGRWKEVAGECDENRKLLLPFPLADTEAYWKPALDAFGIELEPLNNEAYEVHTPHTTALDDLKGYYLHVQAYMRELDKIMPGCFFNIDWNVSLSTDADRNCQNNQLLMQEAVELLFLPSCSFERIRYLINNPNRDTFRINEVKKDPRAPHRKDANRLEIKCAEISATSDFDEDMFCLRVLRQLAENPDELSAYFECIKNIQASIPNFRPFADYTEASLKADGIEGCAFEVRPIEEANRLFRQRAIADPFLQCLAASRPVPAAALQVVPIQTERITTLEDGARPIFLRRPDEAKKAALQFAK